LQTAAAKTRTTAATARPVAICTAAARTTGSLAPLRPPQTAPSRTSTVHPSGPLTPTTTCLYGARSCRYRAALPRTPTRACVCAVC
jgi:hypothetical protein